MPSSPFSSSPPAALFIPGFYSVESSWKLAERVRETLLKSRDLEVDVRPVPELEELEIRRPVSPIELLLGLGKTTSALPGLAAPGAGGLPGLAALRTASKWAIIRYLWAFAEHRPQLRLSALTDQVRQHQRTLFSEHFGIAVTTDLIEQMILSQPAQVVDADAVSYDQVLGSVMDSLGTHKPDYFWYSTEGGRLSNVLVVEAKGNSAGRTESIRQLCRGVEQVLVPNPIPGVTMRRIVIGVTLAGGHLKAFAVEAAKPSFHSRKMALENLLSEGRRDMRPDQEWSDHLSRAASHLGDTVGSENVIREASDLDQARLLSYAGAPVTPETFWEFPQEVGGLVESLEAVDSDGITFRCENTQVALGGRLLEVRTGVAEELLIPTTPTEASQRRAVYALRRQRSRYAFAAGRSRNRPDEQLRLVTSPDGCMLSVSIL
ncbi:hypothetical protein AB0L22_17080 [Micromonospora haikouensis]|uniref:hypothetical protein n=1 Tax=Micromonospora haikouensis TaxID=686309 RepID=UPI003419C4A1